MCDDVNANKSLNGNERETPSIRSRLTHGFKILRRHGGWPGLRRGPGSRRGLSVCRGVRLSPGQDRARGSLDRNHALRARWTAAGARG